MRSSHERLRDILDAIEKINRFVPIELEELLELDERQVWFVYYLQLIGEAARYVPENIRQSMPQIQWKQWVGLRHILVHEYFGIDVKAVHSAISQDLVPLAMAIKDWLESDRD